VSRPEHELDAVVVGAGFAGLYALHRLRGLGLDVRVLEAASGIGGTWFWNCYPGARCDIESVDYSYSFSEELEQEWSWSERYPSQPEILRYLNHVADRFDLRRDIELDTRVASATWDEAGARWTIETDNGRRYGARFCVLATGCLSAPKVPDIPGLDSFRGDWYQTARWPKEPVSFAGRRVGVVGTGSTGIQVIPELAREAAHVTVFQRTASFSVPNRNRPMDPEFERELKARYREHREQARQSPLGVPVPLTERSALEDDADVRERAYREKWEAGGGIPLLFTYGDLLVNPESNETVADFFRARIRETVADREVAELLCPRDLPVGARRLCQDTGYYETFNRDNVTLVDVRSDPIEAIVPRGIRLRSGAEHELDAIVFATGFDAMTGALFAIDIRGRDGVALREKWADGPRAYLGLATAGFPNLFTITGPGSPSVLSNMVLSIEQHVDWIAGAIDHLRAHGLELIEATATAEDAWAAHVNEVAETTLFPKANTWYNGANVPGKPRVFMPYVGGVGPYRERCDEIAARGYEGFALA
jgi:cyclohexanone monooxygenase